MRSRLDKAAEKAGKSRILPLFVMVTLPISLTAVTVSLVIGLANQAGIAHEQTAQQQLLVESCQDANDVRAELWTRGRRSGIAPINLRRLRASIPLRDCEVISVDGKRDVPLSWHKSLEYICLYLSGAGRALEADEFCRRQ